MNEQKNNGRGIFYGVIGVATLVVAIIGATFAYFTATASNNTTITGNMATVSLSLAVEKVTDVDETKGGMIPMSNGMVGEATDATTTCVDDNGNAVCQIYKITLTNDSSAGQFVDGYVSLIGGSGTATDIEAMAPKYAYTANTEGTTMRWAQAFPGTTSGYSTGGTQYLLNETASPVTITAIGDDDEGHATSLIKTAYGDVVTLKSATGATEISGNKYDTITSNYIRLSDHAKGSTTYDRTTDITSALVFNHSVGAGQSVDYYIVVWLSETGTNQTPAEGANLNFFGGNVTFVSAQGSEVSATFTGYTRVPAVAQTPAA